MKLLIVLIIILVAFVGFNYFSGEIEVSKISQVCFEENCFDVEIADDNEERARGLMFREELCGDCGMLFIFDEPTNSKFWMKNTLIPLDIIWMDENFIVQYVSSETPICENDPCPSYGPSEDIKSLYVLEINAGVSEEIRLGIGKKMIFN